jgi:hypothetical protein
MMPFNNPNHCDTMHTLKNYIATTTFLSAVGWGRNGSADMLKNKVDKEDAVIIVIRKVNKDRVFCGPNGDWSSANNYGSLKAAKYTFTISCPDEDVFARNFDTAFKALGNIQANIASTQNCELFLLGEGDKVNEIRFSAPVFEERSKVRTVRLQSLFDLILFVFSLRQCHRLSLRT